MNAMTSRPHWMTKTGIPLVAIQCDGKDETSVRKIKARVAKKNKAPRAMPKDAA